MNNYWLHRISHKSEASYPLLKEGYLSIGFSEFSNEEFLEKLRSEKLNDENNAWEYFEQVNNEVWGELRRTRYNLWRFLYEFKIDDIVLVPMYKSFSLYKIVGNPIISGNLDIEIEEEIKGNGKDLLYKEDPIDIGFLIPVEKLEVDIDRSKYADAPLTSRMKMRQTNGNITKLKASVDNALEKAEKNTPISLYGEVIEEVQLSLLKNIRNNLRDDKFEKLIKWYFDKIGADRVEIPSKNERFKTDGSDGDMIADFELIKVRILVQAKYHEGETSDWAIEQISKYSEQHEELGDGEYTYINWAVTTGDDFSEKAISLAEEKNVRLINGMDFARMLIDAGIKGIDQAFN